MKDYTYYAIIFCDENNQPVLVTKMGKTYPIISEIEGVQYFYDQNNVDTNKALICGIKFFDGTESINIERANEMNFVDIYSSISSLYIFPNTLDCKAVMSFDMDYLNHVWEFIDEISNTDYNVLFENFENKPTWVDGKLNKE
jgi:hypothetical protein